MAKILVTGGAGYIGCILLETLLEQGHEVTCLDRFFMGEDKLSHLASHARLRLVRDDIRGFDPSLLTGIDAVVDMAALSNDPSGDLDAEKTEAINFRGRRRVCELAKQAGVKRYVLISSCSVYGANTDTVSEETRPNPITTYAKCNLMAESCLEAASDDFCVTVLRLATAFGVSPRMRFDLAVNLMTLSAFKHGEINVLGRGMQWRPFVHIKDIADATATVLKADVSTVNGQVFNVGSTRQSIKVVTLAYLIRELLPFDTKVKIVPDDPDKRTYRVNCDKIRTVLGWEPAFDLEYGIKEVYRALRNGEIWDELDTVTVNWYKYLLRAHETIRTVVKDGEIL